MSKLKFAGIVVLTAIVAGMALCFFCKPLYYRLYWGDRITGSIKASIDGVPVVLDGSCFSSSQGINVTVNEFDTSISMKAGEYGSYSFEFVIPDVNIPVQVFVHHFNWWSVTELQLTAEVSTDGNIVSVAYVCISIDDKGEEQILNTNRNFDADTDEIELSLGA